MDSCTPPSPLPRFSKKGARPLLRTAGHEPERKFDMDRFQRLLIFGEGTPDKMDDQASSGQAFVVNEYSGGGGWLAGRFCLCGWRGDGGGGSGDGGGGGLWGQRP